MQKMLTKQSMWLMFLTCGTACSPDPTPSQETQNASDSSGTSGTSGTPDVPAPTGSGEATTTGSTGDMPGMPDMPSMPDLPDMPDMPPDGVVPDVEGCHPIYAQDLLPTFEITVHPEVWQQLMDEWDTGSEKEEAGLEYNPYHPLIDFKYGDIVITNAAIRLKGNPTHWTPLPDDKMQFQIGFHTVDKKGNFLGIRRLNLDAATYNRHMLRDRLALRFMRKVGLPVSCANNARLVVNGEYYGLFTNIEKLDEIYLKRTMEDPSGDLWDRHNWELKTNEDSATDARLQLLRNAETLAELAPLLDVEVALRTYAAEAVIPDSDGAWAGGLNFFVYDDPTTKKFRLLSWDLDNTFERFNDDENGPYPVNPDPFVWEKPTSHGRPWYDIITEDPTYFALYVDFIDEFLHTGYEPELMLGWIDEMSAQIEEAVLTDINKPYTNDVYYDKLQELRDYVQLRYTFVDTWLQCWQQGGVDDGDGYCEAP